MQIPTPNTRRQMIQTRQSDKQNIFMSSQPLDMIVQSVTPTGGLPFKGNKVLRTPPA